MIKNHQYKVGQQVRQKSTGKVFYIIGINTCSIGIPETKLIVHEKQRAPSRNGKIMWPAHCEIINHDQSID